MKAKDIIDQHFSNVGVIVSMHIQMFLYKVDTPGLTINGKHVRSACVRPDDTVVFSTLPSVKAFKKGQSDDPYYFNTPNIALEDDVVTFDLGVTDQYKV